jgi:hypothetical protein
VVEVKISAKNLKNVDTLPAYPIASRLYFAGKTKTSWYEKEIHFAIRLL